MPHRKDEAGREKGRGGARARRGGERGDEALTPAPAPVPAATAAATAAARPTSTAAFAGGAARNCVLCAKARKGVRIEKETQAIIRWSEAAFPPVGSRW
jgi:hypothetical protein